MWRGQSISSHRRRTVVGGGVQGSALALGMQLVEHVSARVARYRDLEHLRQSCKGGLVEETHA